MNDPQARKADSVARMQTELDELRRDLDQLCDHNAEASAPAQVETQRRLKVLRDLATRVTSQLADAKNTSAATWMGVEGNIRRGCAELKEALRLARQWAVRKVSP
jgi:hypothetical protein